MIVELTDEAAAGLEAIGDYIAHDSPQRAASFIQELREKCLELAHLPERFPLAPRYEDRGIRRRVHGHYLIFYRVEVEKVVVVAILPGAMDYEPILFPS
jgi:plasmid stabilization system protein ParE